MLFSAIPDILSTQEAVDMVTKNLGYPKYFIPFIGVAKLLGVVALIVPGFPEIKEWAHAGFVFDLTGAVYSSIAVGDPPATWMPIFIGFALIAASYIYYHKKLKAASMIEQRGKPVS
jgi:hypothetical protein